MNLVYLGKVTSFHGVKGEIRIKSDFDYKEKAFQIGNKILVDKEEYSIISYRRHKDYEMIKLQGYEDLNSVLFLKNKKVYINKEDLHLEENELLESDYIGLKVICKNEEIGVITNISKISLTKKIIVVEYKEKGIFIPFEFIQRVDVDNKKIYIEYIEGLF